ncbi:MAG: hypothetical protein ACJ789_13865 [Thermomicrobiales bacterium]
MLIVVVVGLAIPLEIRHSARFGFSKTVDFDRSIAVTGGYVSANYPDFNRVDLDLRAYTPGVDFDLTVHVRPASAGAQDIRVLHVQLPAEKIFHRKSSFGDPFIRLEFNPIRDSEGQTYYVWVERGPRNLDDIINVWSIKSYSRQPGATVVAAFLRHPPGGSAAWFMRILLAVSSLGILATVGWLVSALTKAVMVSLSRLAQA